ncbi:YaeQ family protein [Myxococcota bacterium]|nr:YaeQ family protein [Myxococcota bacterium]
MARGATLYRAILQIAQVDRDVYGRIELMVALHPSETIERMVARVLAHALRYEDGLAFGRGVSTRDEPDLWSQEPDGHIRQWVEVGQPGAKRLIHASRRADRVSVFAFGPGLQRWRQAQLGKLEALDNLGICRVGDDFIEEVSAGLGRRFEWSITMSGGALFVEDGGRAFETALEVWMGDPLG